MDHRRSRASGWQRMHGYLADQGADDIFGRQSAVRKDLNEGRFQQVQQAVSHGAAGSLNSHSDERTNQNAINGDRAGKRSL